MIQHHARAWDRLVYEGPSSQRLCSQVRALGITSTAEARALLDDPEQRQNVLVAKHGFRQPDLDALRALIDNIDRKIAAGRSAS